MELPARYREFIERFISVARRHIEAGHGLVPFAFVANLVSDRGTPVQIDTRDDTGKERTASAIEKEAAELDADCIFTIMQAWGLPRDLRAQYDEMVERYGSITNCPYRVDAVNFILETRHGVWAGQAPIEPREGDERKRTFGEVTLQHMDGGEGRFAKLLPGRNANQSGSAPLQ